MASVDREEHGFRDPQQAEARRKQMQDLDGIPRIVINLGFFNGLSIITRDTLERIKKKAA